MIFRRTLVVFFLSAALLVPAADAGEVASANLNIIGIALQVPASVDTGAEIPAVIQTTFGGKTNDDVPETGMTVVGELTGPGLDAPITVTTRPGGKFTLPPLHDQGDYTVQNIRLVDAKGAFVQYALPTFTVVHVVGVLGTKVTVTQLTPDDLRARGISIDSRNYDVYGRPIDEMHTDGSQVHFDYDGFGRVVTYASKDSAGAPIYTRTTMTQPDGQVSQVDETGATGDAGSRTTKRAWDGGGRTAGMAVDGKDGKPQRAAAQQYDSAGRIQSSKSGTGTELLMSGAFTEATWKEYGDQYLAPKMQSTENKVPPSAPPQSYESQMQFDTAGNAKSVNVGALAWSTKFDQAGNVTSAQEPGLRGTHAMSYNAVGAVTTETLADGTSQQSHAYNATGSSTAFNDPTHEATGVTPDNLGRPLIINYKDNTTQQIKYDGARVVAVKDRQDRWQSFTYTGGHVTDIWNSETPDSGAATHLDHIDYDNAGRVIHSTTPDVKVDYDTFTLDGLPQHTRQTRFKDHSGFGTQQELDHFDQTHHYNGHGERTSYSVPGGGAPGWSANVTIGYDAMGNIELLRLADLEVRIPRFEIVALERLADRDGKSVDAVLARELLDVVSAHSEYLAKAIPGFTAALRWPQ